MKDYAIIGQKKAGKTTLAKSLVRRIAAPGLLVYDKNNEWGFPLRSMPDFLERARSVRAHTIVIEDAGVFFSERGRDGKLLDVLTAARHTRNTCIILFHALRQLPPYVVDQLDGVFIMPTRDVPGKVADRFGDFPDIVDAHADVMARKASGEPHPWEFVNL